MPDTLHILLVEDSPVDVELTREAVASFRSPCELVTVKDGEAALACLRGEGEYAGEPLPDLILLDLNLPLRSGREVLRELKSDATLRHVPIVVFSSSESRKDIETVYELLGNSYLSKPMDPEKYIEQLHTVLGYWSLVRRPPRG